MYKWLTSLSWSLGSAQTSAHTTIEEVAESYSQGDLNDEKYKAKIFYEASHILKNLLQNEIRKQSTTRENMHEDPSFLNIDFYLKDIDHS